MYTIDDIEIFIMTYNRAGYLKESIDSMLNQTANVKSITVLDNNSSDNTEQLVLAYGNRSVKYIKTFGFLGNFKKAREIVSKKYCMLFHDDDILHPQYLEIVLAYINSNPNVAMLTTGYTEFYNDNIPPFAKYVSDNAFCFHSKKDFANFMYFNEIIAYATAIYKTIYFKNIDLEYSKYSKFNDWPFMVKFADYGDIILFSDLNLFLVRRHAFQDTWTSIDTPTIKQIINWDKFFYDSLDIKNASLKEYQSFMNRYPFFLFGKYEYFLSATDKQKYSKDDVLKLSLESGIGEHNKLYKPIDIKKELEIILITYNRCYYLQRTLKKLFAEDSPVRNLQVTILDNKSTDGTSDLIAAYESKHSNIRHVVNNRNIGGNANISRAFELATYKYVWVLCDDDFYDWSNWKEVEQAIAFEEDAICVALYAIRDRNSIEDLLLQLTFVPACIYKTSNINETCLRNAYENTWNAFPQLAPVINLFNMNKNIHLLEKAVVENGWIESLKNDKLPMADASHTRGDKLSELFPTTKNFFWHSGFANSLSLLNDRQLAQRAICYARTNKAVDQQISNAKVLVEVVRIARSGSCDQNMVIFWNYYYRCDKNTRRQLLSLMFPDIVSIEELDEVFFKTSDFQPITNIPENKRRYPKWLICLICCFIPKKKNRKALRAKYIR